MRILKGRVLDCGRILSFALHCSWTAVADPIIRTPPLTLARWPPDGAAYNCGTPANVSGGAINYTRFWQWSDSAPRQNAILSLVRSDFD